MPYSKSHAFSYSHTNAESDAESDSEPNAANAGTDSEPNAESDADSDSEPNATNADTNTSPDGLDAIDQRLWQRNTIRWTQRILQFPLHRRPASVRLLLPPPRRRLRVRQLRLVLSKLRDRGGSGRRPLRS